MKNITEELEQAVARRKQEERHDSLIASVHKLRGALRLLDEAEDDFLNAGMAEEFPHLWREIRKASNEALRCTDWARRETLALANEFGLKTGGNK